MSDASSYYFADGLISGFGRMRFLQVFHQADTSAGADLLGSIVDRSGPPLGRFPVPYHMAKPQTFLRSIRDNRKNLNVDADDPVILTTMLSGISQTVTMKRANVLKTDISALPNIPLTMQLGFDWNRLTTASFVLGSSARIESIPHNYGSALYKWCEGKYKVAMPEIKFRLDAEYIVDQVLIARNVEMLFSSSTKFDQDVEAKVETLNATVGGKVKYSFAAENTISVKVTDGVDYLIALNVTEWGRFR